MQALEVCNLRLISRFDQNLKCGFYKGAHAPAQNGLFAEEITFRLFLKRRLYHARSEIPRRPCVSQRVLLGLARCVLVNCKKSRHGNPFYEKFTHTMARTFRSNHRDVDESRWLDLSKVNIETMSKHQCLACAKVGLDRCLENAPLLLIRNKNHDHVGILRRLFNCCHGKAVVLCASRRRTACICRDTYVDT